MRWDPAQYARFSDERSRPFFDLTGQIAAEAPGRVVDLGCGSGELTATLATRWPGAAVCGLDSSPEMVAKAPRDAGVAFEVARAEDFTAAGVDVLVSNAMLHWVPGHGALLARWAAELNAGGWLAFQVPDNFGSPSHQLMGALAESTAWREPLAGVVARSAAVLAPDRYLDILAAARLDAQVWQSEYLHVLQGPDPVLEWVRGTSLRPVLAKLPADAAAEFTAEFAALLREAYPPRDYGTVFPFRRTFAVARKPAERQA